MGRRIGELRSHWIDVDGLPIHARAALDQAPPDAPAVVLVHGMGVSSRYLVPTGARLAPDFRVYAPDLPGFGRSGKPRHVLDVPELADALAAWMHAAGLKCAALLGNSFGCQIIATLAVQHPERVERAVLQGPTVPRDERTIFWQLVRWRKTRRWSRLP
jgi:2-hydroxy-6-oxonona-2,4-dienedioate hydrolase